MLSKPDLVSALNGFPDESKNIVLEMIDKHPDMVKMLSETKDKDGKPLFNALEINNILLNCRGTIEYDSDRMVAVLNDPEEINKISSYEKGARGYPLWESLIDYREPHNLTTERNPETFSIRVEKQLNTNEEQNITNRLAATRKRLAEKTSEESETNLKNIKEETSGKNVLLNKLIAAKLQDRKGRW